MKYFSLFALLFMFTIGKVNAQIANYTNVSLNIKEEKPVSLALKMELNNGGDEDLISSHLINAGKHRRSSINYTLGAVGSMLIGSFFLQLGNTGSEFFQSGYNSIALAVPFYVISAVFAGNSIYHSYKHASELEKAGELYYERNEKN